jgi:hypothetical protein
LSAFQETLILAPRRLADFDGLWRCLEKSRPLLPASCPDMAASGNHRLPFFSGVSGNVRICPRPGKSRCSAPDALHIPVVAAFGRVWPLLGAVVSLFFLACPEKSGFVRARRDFELARVLNPTAVVMLTLTDIVPAAIYFSPPHPFDRGSQSLSNGRPRTDAHRPHASYCSAHSKSDRATVAVEQVNPRKGCIEGLREEPQVAIAVRGPTATEHRQFCASRMFTMVDRSNPLRFGAKQCLAL